jgi:acyl carrier protein
MVSYDDDRDSNRSRRKGAAGHLMDMDQLIEALRAKIVEILILPDVKPADIPLDGQLVGGELGIDSLDTLEMVIMIERDYGVVIDNKELGAKVLASLRTLAAHIKEKSPRLTS